MTDLSILDKKLIIKTIISTNDTKDDIKASEDYQNLVK
jgi:hypothetical protein